MSSVRWSETAVVVAACAGAFALAWLIAWGLRYLAPRTRAGLASLLQSVIRVVGMLAMVCAAGWYVGLPLVSLFIRMSTGYESSTAHLLVWYTNFAGTACVSLWIAVRRGHAITCSRCGYAMSSRFKCAPNCPECNNAWKQFGGTNYGHRLSIWLLIIGLVIYLGATAVGATVI